MAALKTCNKKMSLWNHSFLLLFLGTVIGDDCRQKPGYSDSRMNKPSKSPLWEALDTNAGLVQFYFNESYQTNEIATLTKDESWILELYHLFEMDDQAVANTTFQNCTMNGTSRGRYLRCIPLTCIPSDGPNCRFKSRLHSKITFFDKAMSSQEVKWQFRYVYSGWYVLSSNNGKTVSAPVLLKTNYTKDYLRGKPLYPVIKNQNNSTVAVTITGQALDNDCANPMIKSSCVQIEFQNMQTFFIYYNKTEGIKRYCSDVKIPVVSLMEVKWQNELYFELSNLPSKIDATFKIKIFDTRCARGVWNWDDKKGETCLWISKKFNVTAYDGYQPELPEQSASSKIPVVLGSFVGIIGMTGVIIVAVIIFLGTRSKKRPQTYQPTPRPPNPQLPPSSIFLLYARDCDIFMGTMEKFRHLLEKSTRVPIYDIWDEKRRNELDTQLDISALNFLEPKNTRVKVIVVVTPVSRTIETLIIKNQWPFCGSLYNEPDSRDEVFVSTFRGCICLAHTHPERCRKFIITRLHTIGCVENQFISFTEPLCTIYTLPIHLDRIFGHMFDGQWDQQNLSNSDLGTFETKIEELNTFMKLNPAYEEKLLSIATR